MSNQHDVTDPNVLNELDQLTDANNFTDNEILLHTRGLKLRIIDTLTEGGIMPRDPKEVNALMNVINSVDKTAQTNIRNSIDQDTNANVAEATALIAAMERQMGSRDPFLRDVTPNATYDDVVIEQKLIDTDFVEGELSLEARDLQYDTFVEKFD